MLSDMAFDTKCELVIQDGYVQVWGLVADLRRMMERVAMMQMMPVSGRSFNFSEPQKAQRNGTSQD